MATDFDWGAVRAAQAAAGCTFRARTGYAPRCEKTATRIRHNGWGTERRCERHFKVDARTYKARGYANDLDKYEAFDADTAKHEALVAYRAAKVAKADAFWGKAAELVEARNLVALRTLVTGRG